MITFSRDSNTSMYALEASDISFGYSADRVLFHSFSAQFEHGTMTAITGESGRGKSTLLYLLGLMLRPTSGAVIVGGESVSHLNDAKKAHLRSGNFGFVFQDSALDSTRTVLDNVTEPAFYRGVPRAKLEDHAKDLLAEFGVDVPVHRKPGQVSGGQAQRIALCRALVLDPPIVLADEPTGNLDAASSRAVISGLRMHADSGAAVVIVTHTPDVAASCDMEITV